MSKQTASTITRRALGTLGVAAVAAFVAFQIGKARADGIPTSPLVYSGYLEDGAGKPVSGPIAATVKLFGAETGGEPTCTTARIVDVGNGWFSVPLDGACTNSIKGAPDQWAELTAGITTLPRQRISTVPYAVEAGRARVASGAEGALRSELDAAVAANGAVSAKTDALGAKTDAAVAALEGRLGGSVIFNKPGNNGSVTCFAFCDAGQFGRRGSCIAGRTSATKELWGCGATAGQPLDCLCADW